MSGGPQQDSKDDSKPLEAADLPLHKRYNSADTSE